MGKTAGNYDADGNLIAGGDVTAGDDITAGDDLVVGDDLSVGGDAAVTGNTTVTGHVAGGGARVGEVDSASNEYDFFYADGTNRPKVNAFQTYDFGANKFQGVYLYNKSWKFTA